VAALIALTAAADQKAGDSGGGHANSRMIGWDLDLSTAQL
jgi:hypothetical protein